MNKLRTAKVATVDELKAKVDATSTAVVTEYRGMTVAEISALRRQLRTLDADFKVFKNTLVRRAIAGTSVELLSEFLEGPTAIAFVNGDVSAVAKALRDFAKATPTLVVKGGVLDGKALSGRELAALADLPSRDALLGSLLGLLSSPLTSLAGLLKAIPQNFAYGLSALIDSKGGVVVAPAPVEIEETAATPAGVEEAAPAVSDDTATVVAEVAVEAPGADAEPDTPAASKDATSEPAN